MDQLIIIGGGEVFKNDEEYFDFLREYKELDFPGTGSRKDWLVQACSYTYEVQKISMPSKWQASYEARNIWFKNHLSSTRFTSGVLVGYSLGAMFLMKFLSENDLPGIKQLHLVAGALYDEGYGGFSTNPDNYHHVLDQCEEIFLYHSKDDSIVPFKHLEKFSKALPSAKVEEFETRDHFFQPAFPELLANIGVYDQR